MSHLGYFSPGKPQMTGTPDKVIKRKPTQLNPINYRM
jgi:hypothetical protein